MHPSDLGAPLVPAAERLSRKEDAAAAAARIAKRKLLIGTCLCFCFMIAEIVGGYMAHSLAIVTDAAHMLSDIAGRLWSGT